MTKMIISTNDTSANSNYNTFRAVTMHNNGILVGMALRHATYQFKSALADVWSVSPPSEQRLFALTKG